MTIFLRTFLALTLFLLCSGQQIKAALLNGDFETGTVYPDHWTYSGGIVTATFAGPLFSYDPVSGLQIFPPELPAIDGTMILSIIHFGGSVSSTISQNANYMQSQDSLLSLYVAVESQDISITSGILSVLWDSSIVLEQNMSGDNSLSSDDWIHFSQPIYVTEGFHTLTVLYIVQEGFPLSNVYIDAISIPEPRTYALFASMGFLFLFHILRKRNTKT